MGSILLRYSKNGIFLHCQRHRRSDFNDANETSAGFVRRLYGKTWSFSMTKDGTYMASTSAFFFTNERSSE
jgi:hypothetical protein